MSTSPTFKYRGPDKRCPFPFNRDAATSPGSSYDYVTLTETSGDEGLAEACRIWWLLEEVVFTPSGTVTDEYGNTASFSVPSPYTWSVEPVDRVANDFNGMYDPNIPLTDDLFYVAYVSGEWRLYYHFYFEEYGDYAGIRITNPAWTTSVPELGSGTFTLFGYTLEWKGYGIFGADDDGTPWSGSASGAGLSATSTFYTLYTPE